MAGRQPEDEAGSSADEDLANLAGVGGGGSLISELALVVSILALERQQHVVDNRWPRYAM